MVFCRIPVLENQVNSEFNGRYGSSADDTVHGVQEQYGLEQYQWPFLLPPGIKGLMYGVRQLIGCPTRITSTISTLIDNILTNNQENISQSGTIDTLDFFYKQLV